MKAPLCDCDKMDVTIIQQGDGDHHAMVTWCEKHGKHTTCYLCDPNNHTTEVCIEHNMRPFKIERMRESMTRDEAIEAILLIHGIENIGAVYIFNPVCGGDYGESISQCGMCIHKEECEYLSNIKE